MSRYAGHQRILRDLRKRRGCFRDPNLAAAEMQRLLAKLPEGSIERRAFEICEVECLPFKAAAELLNVSMRQLFRIRIAMLEYFGAPSVPATVEPVVAHEQELIEAARMLFKHGHVERCDAHVNRVLERNMPSRYVAEALLVQSYVRTEQGRFEEAHGLIESAKTFIARADDDERIELNYHRASAEAYVPYRAGLFDRSIAIAEDGLNADVPQDASAIRTLIRYLIALGVQHQEAGSPVRALELTSRARSLALTLPVPPAAELAQIAMYNGWICAALPNRASDALKEAHEGLRIARWHGLVFEEIWANMAVGWVSYVAGKPEDGFSHINTALALADGALDGDPRARTYFVSASIESAAKRWTDALNHIRVARPLVQHLPWMASIADMREARARFAHGDDVETLNAASRAIQAFAGINESHYLGEAFLTKALALARNGEKPVEEAEAAVAYLEKGGTIADLATAFELSHRLTGREAHRRRANELRMRISRIAS